MAPSAITETITEPTYYKLEISGDDKDKYAYSHLKPYTHPPETKDNLSWSELVTLDLSQIDVPGGKESLAKQLEHAVHHVGFFYVKNFGISQDKVEEQFTLAKNFFDLPVDEKLKYECDRAKGEYNGYRGAGHNKIG